MSARIRCSFCKEYILKEDSYRHGRVGSVCSEGCFVALSARRRQRKQSKKVVRVVDSVPPEVKAAVRQRDGFKCRFCGGKNNLQVHHIFYRSQGGSHEPHNLIVLCFEHHRLVHSDKGRWQPVLLAMIWLYYVCGRMVAVSEAVRIVDSFPRA